MKLIRFGIVGAALLALAACSSESSQPNVTGSLVKGVVAKVKGEKPPPTPTVEQLRAAVTPEVRAANGNVPVIIAGAVRKPVNSVLFMSGQNGDVRTYLTPDSISLSLRDGILVASRGLGEDLMSADVSGVRDRIRAGSGQANRGHRYLNGENQIYVRTFTCTYAKSGAEVVESCTGESDSFENRYVLRNGQIAVSVQWLGPNLGSFRIEDLG